MAFVAGCSSNGNAGNNRANGTLSENADCADEQGNTKPDPNETGQGNSKPEQSEEGKKNAGESRKLSWQGASREELENELARYREDRKKGVSSHGAYDMVKAPNEANYKYGIGPCDNEPKLDDRERNLLYKAVGDYVEETLHLEGDYWACVDPRMNAIYEDEDKGVAKGYDSENIYLFEYDDNGRWRYLIMVREGKGSEWKVLWHGDYYKTQEGDGGGNQ